MNRFSRAGIVLIFFLYLFFGFLFLDIPSVKSDELWETSRAYYLKNHLHPGEPLLPKEIAPFFASIQELGWQSWFIGSLKFGTSAILMSTLPIDPLQANRLNGFFWSISVCVFTYFLGRKFGLDRWTSLLCSAMLIVIPEFLQQVHRERPEMVLSSLFLLGILMLWKALEATDGGVKKRWLFVTGLYSWLPSMLVHASGIVIPATIGILYLIHERKYIFTVNTIIIGIGLAGGLLFFFYIKNSMGSYALSQGGSDFYDSHACPPIVCEGLKYIFRIPAVFYNKFVKANIFSQPVSFVIFIFSIAVILKTLWNDRGNLLGNKNIFILTSITIPLLIMLLLSGSYGNYNLIVTPFVVIGIALYLEQYILRKHVERTFYLNGILILLLFACLSSNVIGMQNQYIATQEYRRINKELRSVIPADANVMGMSLYYLPFRDQNYYSVTWFEPSVGKSDLTFEKAIRMKNINYIIADDAFASRANFRGRGWSDSLVTFLDNHATMVQEIHAKMYLKIVPDSTQIPPQFQYDGFEKSYVKRIRVYKILS